MTPEQEVRMRVVEALTRTDGTKARNEPDAFLTSVAKITTFVLVGQQTEKPEPEPEAPPAPKRKGKGATADKPATEAGNDFME